MAVDLSSADGLVVRNLIPLVSLPSVLLRALAADMVIEEIHNDFLFKKGDTDKRLIYLIKGTVILQAQGLVVDTLNIDNDSARFALAHQIPRKIDALAKGTVRFLRLDAETINNPPALVYQEDTGYVVFEESQSDTDDWMTPLLKSHIFQNMSPVILQKITLGLEPVNFNKGEIILKQGTTDAYYYVIKNGTCLLTHKPAPEAAEIKLAHIGKGNTLGEDALIFNAPRTETITALTQVSLLRLPRQQFISLIKEPSLQWVDCLEMQQLLLSGAIILDIRTLHEYGDRHITGSINIPFPALKARYKKLSVENSIIIVGNDASTNEAAAFFLIKHKYRALILKVSIGDIVVTLENAVTFFSYVSDFSTQQQQDDTDWKPQYVYTESAYGHSNNDLDARIDALTTENILLKKNYAELNQHLAHMKADKEAAEKQYRILFKQVEKLTQVLNKFKGTKTQ